MKNIKRMKNYIVFFLALVIFGACEKFEYLDQKAENDDVVWKEFERIEKALAAVYGKLPEPFMNIGDAYRASATDDAEHTNEYSSISRFNFGGWNAFNNPDDTWKRNYEGIRLANKFIESVDTVSLYNRHLDPDAYIIDSTYLVNYKGEARFLRAYFYFELIKRYGSVPIIKTTLGLDDQVDLPRNTYSECVEFIADECDSSMKYLPVIQTVGSRKGRATASAALALKARTYLYAASKLNNSSGSIRYYDSCIVAAKQLIDGGNFSLTDDYNSMFTPGENAHANSRDAIFTYRENKTTNTIETRNQPIGFTHGKGQTNPSQNLVDAYEMIDGSSFDWNNLTHAQAPYENRDPRFYATILYNGVVVQDRPIECWEGGKDGPGNAQYYGTKTGYYLKKGVATESNLVTEVKEPHYWYYFRYAEVLLNYAEALNEVYGPDADRFGDGRTARWAVNEVRARVGMPSITDADQDAFRERLRNERRIELAFEDHRFWDVRRWQIAENTLGAPIMGIDVKREVTQDPGTGEDIETFTYNRKKVEDRVFESKMYFYPIPHSELISNTSLTQTSGW